MKKALTTLVMGAFVSCMAFAAPTTQMKGQVTTPKTMTLSTKKKQASKTGKKITGMKNTKRTLGKKNTMKPANKMSTGTNKQ